MVFVARVVVVIVVAFGVVLCAAFGGPREHSLKIRGRSRCSLRRIVVGVGPLRLATMPRVLLT